MRVEICLLHEIVSALCIDERRAGAPDIGLGRPDEIGEGDGVAARRSMRPILRSPWHTAHATWELSADPERQIAVNCERIREALSARLDGEAADLPGPVIDEHVAGCADCAAWQQQAMTLAARTATPATAPDLVGPVLSAVRAEEAHRARRRRRATATRIGLAAIALVQLAFSGPGLILGHDHTAPIHVAHEVGSFDAALALGLLLAAIRPRLAAGMLPLVAAITGLLLLTAGSDVAAGRTSAFTESPHLLDLAGGLLLLRLAIATAGWAGLRVGLPRSTPTLPAGRG